MIKLRKQTGGLIAKRRGRGFGKGKLSEHEDWVRDKIAECGDITLTTGWSQVGTRLRADAPILPPFIL